MIFTYRASDDGILAGTTFSEKQAHRTQDVVKKLKMVKEFTCILNVVDITLFT